MADDQHHRLCAIENKLARLEDQLQKLASRVRQIEQFEQEKAIAPKPKEHP